MIPTRSSLEIHTSNLPEVGLNVRIVRAPHHIRDYQGRYGTITGACNDPDYGIRWAVEIETDRDEPITIYVPPDSVDVV